MEKKEIEGGEREGKKWKEGKESRKEITIIEIKENVLMEMKIFLNEINRILAMTENRISELEYE